MKILPFFFLIIIIGCKPKQPMSDTNMKEFTPQYNVPGPHAMVYKTKANYNNLVSVELSDDKTKITSYPAPTDVIADKGYASPSLLHSDYLLDNRGISKNSAFIKMTYEEYSRLQTAPSLKELFEMIVDKDP